tara:strand:- start:1025 stop:1627 length:603 start_codon:yes stop_codon:yes gene_type:complete
MNVLFLGHSNVGKTSLITKFTKTKPEATVGIGFYSTLMYSKFNNTKIIRIYEIAGSPYWNRYIKEYLDICDAIFIVYDITCSTSFDYAKKLIRNITDTSKKIILIGNKTDLYGKRQVFIYTVNKFLSECFNEGMVLFHVETSKTNMDSFRRVFQKFCGPPVTEWKDENVHSNRLVPPNIPKPTFTVEKKKNFMELFLELW